MSRDKEQLLKAAEPLIEFINEFHPHHTIILDGTRVELWESQMVNSTDKYLKG